MDSDLWISRLAAAKRQLNSSSSQSDRGVVDEVELEEDVSPEFACPYCFEDHDLASPCPHLEEEHPFESKDAVCPICSDHITKDMLNHIIMQHGHLFKSRRRLHRFAVPSSHAFSLLGRDLREAHLQVLLGSGGHRSSNDTASDISTDSLLSSLVMNFPTSEAEETSKSSSSIVDDASIVEETPVRTWKSSIDSSLTKEERETKRKRESVRATFVQDLLLSTLFGD